jgi:hypothetical protein
MKWLDACEQKFGHLALPGVIRYVGTLMFLIFMLDQSRLLPYEMLTMNSVAIMHGQIWRLITFLLIPQSSNLFFLFFEVMILIMVGDGLEQAWGSFKLTFYYLFGATGTIIAAFFLPGVDLGSYFLNLSLFLAFATLYPDFEILIFFILPVKIKYLAMLSGGWILWTVAVGPWPLRFAALLAIGNYLLFFGPEAFDTARRNKRNRERAARFEAAAKPADEPRHTCVICARTDHSHPDLQFRYCTCPECGPDGRPFCLEHLPQPKAAGNPSLQGPIQAKEG